MYQSATFPSPILSHSHSEIILSCTRTRPACTTLAEIPGTPESRNGEKAGMAARDSKSVSGSLETTKVELLLLIPRNISAWMISSGERTEAD